MFTQIQIWILILVASFALFLINESSSQILNPPSLENTNQQSVTYQKKSNFIHEFSVPNLSEQGLKGIVTDSDGNAWFYHQTNKTSTIIKFNPMENVFISYPIEGNTMTDNAVINLAGGQLIYDEERDSIWFTDARINALGSINTKSGQIALNNIPTNNSGIMGLVLSPDNKSIWFTEIIGNNLGSFDINSKSIREYPTGEFTGPTLLTYDDSGQLWITMAYSSSILRVEPWLLVPGSKITGMFEIKLQSPDSFSPFGIAIPKNTNKLYISDHGSSRIIVSNITSDLKNYTSYWTSPSTAYPVSLPSQVISDKGANVYFLEHGGNKISKISKDGILTEYEIPTGPLATVVYLAGSPDASKIWFTELASNKIGYLDNTLRVPFDLEIKNTLPMRLKSNQTYPLDILVTRNEDLTNSVLSLREVELSLIGMTESGLQGLVYLANPQRFDLTEVNRINGSISLTVGKEASTGKYSIAPRVSTTENDNLTVSLSYPQTINLDIPVNNDQIQNLPVESNQFSSNTTSILFRDLLRYGSVAIALTLIGYLVYRKIRRDKRQ
jgi:virginiamycin B lyase